MHSFSTHAEKIHAKQINTINLLYMFFTKLVISIQQYLVSIFVSFHSENR